MTIFNPITNFIFNLKIFVHTIENLDIDNETKNQIINEVQKSLLEFQNLEPVLEKSLNPNKTLKG